MIFRPDQDAPIESNGESGSGNHRMPVILGSSQGQVSSDGNGLARMTPSVGSLTGAAELEITASAGTNATQQLELESLWPAPTGGGSTAPASSSTAYRNSRNVGGTTSAPAQNYFAGEIWAVAAESGGSGMNTPLVAVPDGQTETLASDQRKPEDERQPDSACDQEQNAAQDCANKIEKRDFPE